MTQPYLPLPRVPLASQARYCRPASPTQKVAMESPAMAVMTDLERVMAITIGSVASIESANQRMIDAAVRLLLVVDGDQSIVGLITATDILGEKPMKHQQRMGGTFSDILVRDIMTPHAGLDVLNLRDVFRARVGDIVASLKSFGRQHALVAERDGNSDSHRVRGIFSATQIGRQLGVNVVPGEIASTFAELEMVLSS
jgi:CBS-domain-containing membrane protein